MTPFYIAIITLSSVMLSAILFLYAKNWKQQRVISKSSANEIIGKGRKNQMLSFFLFSLFFASLFSLSFSSSNSIDYYNDHFLEVQMENNYSSVSFKVNDFTTDPFIRYEEINPVGGDSEYAYILDSSVNDSSYLNSHGSTMISDIDVLDEDGNTQKISVWNSGDTIDLLDRDYLKNSTACQSSVIDPLTNNKTTWFNESNPLYQINKNVDGSAVYQTSYLFCIDNSLSTMQQDFKDTQREFDYVFKATSILKGVNGGFTLNNNKTFSSENSQVQVISIPDKDESNSNKEGKIVNQLLVDNYRDLELNEAYYLSFNHSDKDLNHIGNGDVITLKNNTDLRIVDSVESNDYIIPTNKIYSRGAIKNAAQNWIGTNNIILFVNEQTFYNVLKQYYFNEDTGIWDDDVYNNFYDTKNLAAADSSSSSLQYEFQLSFPRVDNLSYQNSIGVYNFIDYRSNGGGFFMDAYEFQYTLSDYNIYPRGLYIDDDTFVIENMRSLPVPGNNSDDILQNDAIASQKTNRNYDPTFRNVEKQLVANDSTNYLFSSFIFILGIISISILTSSSFNKNVKEIGNLKAIGYSESSVSLICVSRTILQMLLSFMLTFIILPLFNKFWSMLYAGVFASSFPLFSISLTSFLITLVFPLLFFTTLSFLILRFYYVKKPVLKLIKNESTNKPGKLISLIDDLPQMPFNASYSTKNSIRSITKSFTITATSFFISFFVLSVLTISDVTESTIKQLDEEFKINNLSLFSSGNKLVDSISSHDYNEMILNREINEYTFGIDSVDVRDDLLNEASSLGVSGGSCSELLGTVIKYAQDETIANSFIPDESIVYLQEVLFAYGPNISKCNTATITEETMYRIIYNSFSAESLDYELYKQDYPRTKGVSIGYNVLDSKTSGVAYIINTDFRKQVGSSLYEYATDIKISALNSFTSLNDIFLLSDKELNLVSQLNYSEEKDGRVYVLGNSYGVELDEGSKISKSLNIDPNTYGDYELEMLMPYETYKNDGSDDSYLPESERYVDVVYLGDISVPFFSNGFISLSDPDWEEVITSIDPSNSSLAYNDFITGNIIGGSMPIIFSTAIYNDTYDSKVSLNDNVYDAIGTKMSLIDMSSNEYMPLAIDLTSIKDDNVWDVTESFNDGDLKLSDLALYFKDIDSDISTSPYIGQTGVSKLLLDGIIDNSLFEYVNYNSGLTLNLNMMITSSVGPEVKIIQNSIFPMAIMSSVLALFLIVILINELIMENKRNTNIFKTLGHGSSKTTFITYISYPIIILIGFMLSIPLIRYFGRLISTGIGTVSGFTTLVVSPSTFNIVSGLIVSVSIILVVYLLAYLLTLNLRPKMDKE